MSEYDALRKVIEHEANQDDDGGFFARLGGLEPDPEDDGPTARGLFQHVDYTRHKAAQEYLNANTSWDNWYDPPLRSDSLNPHDHTDVTQYIQRRYEPKRSPIVKVRRKWVWIIFRTWAWECQICYISDHQSTWRKAYAQADRHARNHNRSTK